VAVVAFELSSGELVWKTRRPITLTRTNRDSDQFEWFSPTGVGWDSNPERFSEYKNGDFIAIDQPCENCEGDGKGFYGIGIVEGPCQDCDGDGLHRVKVGPVELRQAYMIATKVQIIDGLPETKVSGEIVSEYAPEEWLCVAAVIP